MVKGNFASVLRLVEAQIPLPFANLTLNRRSLISVYNLSDFIRVSLLNSSASNKVFLVSDNELSSTAELFTRIGKAINKPVRLFSVPLTQMGFAASLFGFDASWKRLTDSLVVDSSDACSALNWAPPYSLDHGLRLSFSRYI